MLDDRQAPNHSRATHAHGRCGRSARRASAALPRPLHVRRPQLRGRPGAPTASASTLGRRTRSSCRRGSGRRSAACVGAAGSSTSGEASIRTATSARSALSATLSATSSRTGQGSGGAERDDLPAALELGEEEDVVDELTHLLDLLSGLGKQVVTVCAGEHGGLEQHEQTRQRRPQLVRDRRGEADSQLLVGPQFLHHSGRVWPKS